MCTNTRVCIHTCVWIHIHTYVCVCTHACCLFSCMHVFCSKRPLIASFFQDTWIMRQLTSAWCTSRLFPDISFAGFTLQSGHLGQWSSWWVCSKIISILQILPQLPVYGMTYIIHSLLWTIDVWNWNKFWSYNVINYLKFIHLVVPKCGLVVIGCTFKVVDQYYHTHLHFLLMPDWNNTGSLSSLH